MIAGVLLVLAVIAAGVIAVLGSGSSPAPRPRVKAASTGRTRRTQTATASRSSSAASSTASAGSDAPATSTTSTTSTASGAPTTSTSSSGAQSTSSSTTTPAVSPTPNTPSSSAGDPVTAVKSFYTLAAAHRYAAAWGLADTSMRDQLGGYRSFQAGQAGDRSITFTSARTVSQSPSGARVAITTTSVRTDGTHHCAGTADLVPAAQSGQWQLHQININCS